MGKVISYHFRVDEEVLNNIKVFAEKDGRLLNKEIEYILRQYSIERGLLGNDVFDSKKK